MKYQERQLSSVCLATEEMPSPGCRELCCTAWWPAGEQSGKRARERGKPRVGIEGNKKGKNKLWGQNQEGRKGC